VTVPQQQPTSQHHRRVFLQPQQYLSREVFCNVQHANRTPQTHQRRRNRHHQKRNRKTLHRQILRLLGQRHLHLQTLRRQTLPLRKQFRSQLRMAQLRRRNPRRRKTPTRPRRSTHRDTMRQLRRTPRTRIRGRRLHRKKHPPLRKLHLHGLHPRQTHRNQQKTTTITCFLTSFGGSCPLRRKGERERGEHSGGKLEQDPPVLGFLL
jgi:hypothetical protein